MKKMKKMKKRYIVLVAGLIGILAGCQKIPQDVLENSGEINPEKMKQLRIWLKK